MVAWSRNCGAKQAFPEPWYAFGWVATRGWQWASRVCGVAVSMAAFQAVDPGSTPGTRRKSRCIPNVHFITTPTKRTPLHHRIATA